MSNININNIIIKQNFWNKTGPLCDVVFSSQVRLIRNISGIPFLHRQEKHNVKFITSIAEKFKAESFLPGLEIIDIDAIDGETKRFLRERNIITSDMEIGNNSYVIISNNKDFCILINDEDHFKIQVIKPGLSLNEAYSEADEVDNELNRFTPYAFSSDYGYITSNPNIGGIEVSAMLHLPVLYMTRRMPEVQEIVKLARMNIEGLKNDSMKTFGSMFILSSLESIKLTESELINDIEKVARKIAELESEARESYLSEHGIKLEDRIYRSLGILNFARRIGYVESMDYLSDIRLGIILSIIKNIELQKINDLMINIQWSHLQKIASKAFNDAMDGDIFRASYLRDQLEWSTIYG